MGVIKTTEIYHVTYLDSFGTPQDFTAFTLEDAQHFVQEFAFSDAQIQKITLLCGIETIT